MKSMPKPQPKPGKNKQLVDLINDCSELCRQRKMQQHMETVLKEMHDIGPLLAQQTLSSAKNERHPDERFKSLNQEQQKDVAALAKINFKAISMIAAAGDLTLGIFDTIANNANLVIDSVCNSFTQSQQANRIRIQKLLKAYNIDPNRIDPNSPGAVVSAMQSGNGNLLVNINYDSMMAAIKEKQVNEAMANEQFNMIQQNNLQQNIITAQNIEQANIELAQTIEVASVTQAQADNMQNNTIAAEVTGANNTNLAEVAAEDEIAVAEQQNNAIAENTPSHKGAVGLVEEVQHDHKKVHTLEKLIKDIRHEEEHGKHGGGVLRPPRPEPKFLKKLAERKEIS